MEPVAGLVGERLGHERGVQPLPTGQRVHHQAQHDEPVGGGECIAVPEVLLELAVGVLVVVGVVPPAHGVHVARHGREVVEHGREPTGVVAGQHGGVPLVGRAERAVVVAVQHRVLGLDTRLEHQVLFGRPGDRPLEDHPGRIGPLLALDRGVALHRGDVGLPRQHRVRERVGQRQDVRVGGRLAHGPGGEPGEPGPDLEQVVYRGHRHELGARLAVHLHEHGVDELDAVVGDAGLELFGHDVFLLHRAVESGCEWWHTVDRADASGLRWWRPAGRWPVPSSRFPRCCATPTRNGAPMSARRERVTTSPRSGKGFRARLTGPAANRSEESTRTA